MRVEEREARAVVAIFGGAPTFLSARQVIVDSSRVAVGFTPSSFGRFCTRGASPTRHHREALPTHLSRPELRQLLGKFDRRTVVGKHDYAIGLCLARLGLRAGEVAGLRLEEVDWRNGKVRLRATKGWRQRLLPLPTEVGQALAAYFLSLRTVWSASRSWYKCPPAPS